MGIPSFTRWLLDKYKSCNERYMNSNSKKSSNVYIKKVKKDVKISKSENEESKIIFSDDEFNYYLISPSIDIDNLYIDMNGIIHNITRLNDINLQPPYDEIKEELFKKLDEIINRISPNKLLFLALDGVGPRAKTNQQRARRYVSSLEKSEKQFDSNQISPGTVFMNKVNEWCKIYVEKNLSSNPLWKNLCVILSDSSVPGEGEHKIMDFIRSQKGLKHKFHHCIYSADSDLFVLALSLHEKKISVVREETIYHSNNQPKNNLVIIRNVSKDVSEDTVKSLFEYFGKVTSVETVTKPECKHFVITFEDIVSAQNALKSKINFDNQFYLHPMPHSTYSDASKDMPLYAVTLVKVPTDVKERTIKDLFEGYDIRRIKIVYDSKGNNRGVCIVEFKSEEDQLKALQKSENFEINGTKVMMYPTKPKVLYPKDFMIYEFLDRTGCYSENLAEEHLNMTNWDLDEAIENYNNDNVILTSPSLPALKSYTELIFFHIHTLKEYLHHEFKHAMELLAEIDKTEEYKFELTRVIDDFVLITMLVGNDFLPHLPGCTSRNIDVILRVYKEFLHDERDYITEKETINVKNFKKVLENIAIFESTQLLKAYKNEPIQEDDIKTIEIPLIPVDELKEIIQNYYKNKLKISPSDQDKVKMISQDFFQGLVWMYSYYYKGLQSWSWYYRHHYAPLTKDLVQYMESFNMNELCQLEKSKPLLPIEHLMSVLPPKSSDLVPEVCRHLMLNGSPIKEFYPEEFTLENDPSMPSWAVIPILPIINIDLLINAIKPLEEKFTKEETERNKFSKILVYLSSSVNANDIILLPKYDQIQSENDFKRIEFEYDVFANMEHKIFEGRETFDNVLTLEDLKSVENSNKFMKFRSKIEKPESEGLFEFIDFEASECLNMKPECNLTNLFLKEEGHFIESDVDEQLLINLKFKSPYNIQSIQFEGPKDNGPKTIKLYVNRGTLSFEEIEDIPITQSFVLKDENETVNVMASKFTKCYSLTIFIEDNQSGSEQTRINSISFVGSVG